ncbi:hypothetical protein AC1031_019905 [Aphanomyces cochlioides]|nr:hypothetical protein AC1031_019905 [Aphanomyces cochlioides]
MKIQIDEAVVEALRQLRLQSPRMCSEEFEASRQPELAFLSLQPHLGRTQIDSVKAFSVNQPKTAPTKAAEALLPQEATNTQRATNEALCRMFGICGKVAGFKRNVVNGVPQSLVQVTFETQKAVDKALALEGLELCGKAIHVELWEA